MTASLSLRDFVQHKADHLGDDITCAKWFYVSSDESWFINDQRRCTCRLDEVLARESSLRAQIEKLPRYRQIEVGMAESVKGTYLYLPHVLALVGDDHG